MNLPTGVLRTAGKSIVSFPARQELENLSLNNFSGYTIETLLGLNGIEESALLFRNGQGIGASYEYYGSHATLNGDDSLVHVFNAFASKSGVIDVMDLSVQQVDLVTAFNASIKFSKPLAKSQLKSLVKEEYDSTLGEKISSSAKTALPQTKESLFQKFGLSGIDGK
ncbi:MAG: hypothetical protein V1776_01010 [Candidatus Diapherotrites archaeon]